MLIDMPKIKSDIKNKHSEFMANYGDVVEKVRVDHQLLLQTVYARLKFIAQCFVDEGVIDEAETVMDDNTYHKSFILSKTGFDNRLTLITDGIQIVLKDSGSLINEDVFEPTVVSWADPHKEGFDWVRFSNELLDHIHKIIYERRKASEVKMFSSLYDESDD